MASPSGDEFLFWAMDPSIHSQIRSLGDVIGPENYRLFDEIGDVALYTDGVQLVWEAQELVVHWKRQP